MLWLALACSRPEVALPDPTPSAPAPVLVIGHRGFPARLPDHTLAGYRLAAEAGADAIEPDLVPTRDGHLVARHENELSATTDVAARFPDRKAAKEVDGARVEGWFTEDFTLDELKTLRAVQPRADRPHDHDGQHPIPTFEEVLDLRAALEAELGRPIAVYPETKHPTYFAGIGLPLEPRLVAALRARGLTGEDAPVYVQSFEPASLAAVGRELGVKRILLVGDPSERPFGDARTYGELLADLPALGVHGLGVHRSMVWGPDGPTGLVERAHAAGLRVHVWTFRPEEPGPAGDGDPARELRAFASLGVDGVFADDPAMAHGALAR